MTKTCTTCGMKKPLIFYGVQARGLFGRRSKCKECVGIFNKEYHRKRWDNDAAYRESKTEQSYKWTKENPEERSVIAKRRNIKELDRDPHKVSARALVNQRVRFGRMPKASSLECACGNVAAHYHHHLGYDFENRYAVIPVCHKCHKLLG